jgi:hypothetical protein
MTESPIASPHTGPLSSVLVDGTRVLRIGNSPFAAVTDSTTKNAWNVFAIQGRRMVGWTKGNRAELRLKLIRVEREWLEHQAAAL